MGESIDILFVKLLLKALLRYCNGNVLRVQRRKVTFVDDYSHIIIVNVFYTSLVQLFVLFFMYYSPPMVHCHLC
jgi:hypothetical protein